MASPVPAYRAATFQPSSPYSMTTAISLIMGADTRKEKVTPSGTPAETKPMNSGTAEQEQNGVTTPRRAASTLPTASLRPASNRRVRCGVKNERTTPIPNTTSASSISTLGVSYRKNSTASPRCVDGVSPSTS